MTELSVTERIERALQELVILDRQKWEAEAPFQRELDRVQMAMNDVVGKMHEASAGISQHILQVETLIRQVGVELDKTVKDVESGYQCVHVGAKRKWDNKMLEGYSKVHPEVLECSEMGEVTCQLRRGK